MRNQLKYSIAITIFLLVLDICVVLPQIPKAKAQLDIEKAPIVTGLLWKTSKIPVCWLNPESDPNGSGRKLVIKAIEESWAKHIGKNFEWNVVCQPIDQVSAPEIRILIDPAPSRSSSSIGTYSWIYSNGNWKFPDSSRHDLLTPNQEWQTYTMYLSFGDYYGLGPQGLRYTAIHEFGHALGFLHEQTALDVPESCLENLSRLGSSRDEPQRVKDFYGSYGIYYTRYDEDSVMNYCRSDLFADRLSKGDMNLARRYYPMPDYVVANTPSDYYSISDRKFQKCLTTTPDRKVKMYPCSTQNMNQSWTFTENADHSFVIRPKSLPSTTLTVDAVAIEKIVSGRLKTNYEEVGIMIGELRGDASHWFRTPTNSENKDEFIFQLSLSGFVLDWDTWDRTKHENVILYKDWKGDNQVWKVSKRLN